MKYMKPSGLFSRNDVADFLDSLPDSFEIVPEGHVCVRWPRELTRDVLKDAAEYIKYRLDSESSIKVVEYLETLAAIAPVEKKKRMAYLWEYRPTHARVWTETEWEPTDSNHWRKVGECEVTE